MDRISNALFLTKKEIELCNDVLIYMVDYINDDCFTNSDRKSFDSLYSKISIKLLAVFLFIKIFFIINL